VSNRPTLLADPYGLEQTEKGWLQKAKESWNRFWGNDKPPVLAMNLCPQGYRMLFSEHSLVNRYAHADTQNNPSQHDEDAYNRWREGFNHKCEAAKQPGKYTVAFCGGSAWGPSGPIEFCSCCEGCEEKGTNNKAKEKPKSK
jgi:hypothetical protein